MGYATMKSLVWQLSRYFKSLSMFGVLGIILLLLALSAYFLLVQPAQLSVSQLKEELLAEQLRQKNNQLHPAEVESSSATRMQTFREFFPAYQTAPDLLTAVYQAASAESISLAEGDYKYVPFKPDGLGVYQLDLPVKGSYVQIRRFIAKVLNDIPSAALDEVSFKREAVGSGTLDAKIRFSIYLSAK
jgi:hypothetical protein